MQDFIMFAVAIILCTIINTISGFWWGWCRGKIKGGAYDEEQLAKYKAKTKAARSEALKSEARAFIMADFINGLPAKAKKSYSVFAKQKLKERKSDGITNNKK